MAGYTPLFDSLTTGTLYGRWPDIGLWAVILSLPDKRGIVDVTPEYLAGVTGLPVDDVIACMERFCSPDPRSRSGAEGGARLTLIDPSRSWGWRIVNHSLYRERARKMAYDAERTASGKDAERKRESREVTTRPAKSREVPLSDADANKEKKGADAPVGLNLKAWERWSSYRVEIRKPLKPASIPAAQKALAAFGSDQGAVVEQSIAQGWQGLFPLKEKSKANGSASEWR